MSISEEMKPPRKRIDERSDPIDQTKKTLLENEQVKINLLRTIDQKMDCMVDLLGQIVAGQNKLLANTTPQMHPQYDQILQRFSHHFPLKCYIYAATFMQQHFPCGSNDV